MMIYTKNTGLNMMITMMTSMEEMILISMDCHLNKRWITLNEIIV
jgi:hypothetical protein